MNVHGDFTYRDSASQQVQLFLSFVNFRAITEPAPSLIFFHLQWKDSLPYPKVRVLQQSHVNVH